MRWLRSQCRIRLGIFLLCFKVWTLPRILCSTFLTQTYSNTNMDSFKAHASIVYSFADTRSKNINRRVPATEVARGWALHDLRCFALSACSKDISYHNVSTRIQHRDYEKNSSQKAQKSMLTDCGKRYLCCMRSGQKLLSLPDTPTQARNASSRVKLNPGPLLLQVLFCLCFYFLCQHNCKRLKHGL